MPESSLVKDVYSSSAECRTSPLRQIYQSSLLLHRNSCAFGSFCTEQNVQQCALHINQELASLGLQPVCTPSVSCSEMNAVAVLNCMYELIQHHHKVVRTLENLELEQHKLNSNAAVLQLASARLKEQLEVSKRENTGLVEKERQLQVQVKSLQNRIRNEKEEVQKLQNIIASRASQYNHEMKRKEREFYKLKERLNQLLVDRKDKKQAIDVLNNVGRADGKRSLWKTEKTEARHEGEMYKTLLSDYDSRQRELVLENAELRKVLQQMKKEIVSLLLSSKLNPTGDKQEETTTQADLEEDDSQEAAELFCVHAREKLTNSIRLQWRRLKSHVERLDSQAFLAQMDKSQNHAVPPGDHEEEMNRLRLEIQQCKDFIQTQQQLLQHQFSSPCESMLSDCYRSQEKERLRAEWKNLEEQRTSFERERRNFTEAAIRLSHERQAFEEDRATWLKHQFLNLSPFPDSKTPQMSKSKSAFLISDTEAGATSSLEKLPKCPANAASSPHDLCDSENSLDENFPAHHKCWGNSSHRFTQEENSSV